MRVGTSVRRSGLIQSRRKLTDRYARLRLEVLEDRKLLSVVPFSSPPISPTSDATLPAASTASAASPAETASASISDSSSGTIPTLPAADETPAPPGSISLFRHGVAIQQFDPASDTDVDRGTALRTALAAVQPGDELELAAVTYDMGGTQHVEFPANVTVTGAGKTLTKITSSCPQSEDGAATFALNDQTVIQDLWLEGSLHSGAYQALVGMQDGAPQEDVTAYLSRLQITGDSDGIFVWGSPFYRYTINAFDCDISTNYDAVALLGSDYNRQAVNLYGCSIAVTQPDPIGAHISNCVNLQSGTASLYSCTLTATGDADSIQTDGILNANHGSSTVVNCTFNVTAPSGIVYDLNIMNLAPCIVIGGQGSNPDGSYASSDGSEIYENATPAAVVARNVFYNNSYYDGYNPLPNADDVGAIATDKTAYLPGSAPATFANITSYDKGLNGIMIDLSGQHGDIMAADFTFKMGNNNAPDLWTTAPTPAVVLLPGSGIRGTDRVELIWPDGSIQNKWLEVTMNANTDTGLPAGDTFFFGNAVGDSGLGDTVAAAKVDTFDQLGVRGNPQSYFDHIPATNVFDFNRDGKVDTFDELIARGNPTSVFTSTKFVQIDIPPAATVSVARSDLGTSAVLAYHVKRTSPARSTSALSQSVGPIERVHKTGINPSSSNGAGVVMLMTRENTNCPRANSADADTTSALADLDGELLDSLLVAWGRG